MKKLSRLLFAGALSVFLGMSLSGISAATNDGYIGDGRFEGNGPMEGSGGGIYGPYSSGRGGDFDYGAGGGFMGGGGYMGDGCCTQPPCCDRNNDCCSRFAVGVDYLFWDVTQTGLDVAKTTVSGTGTSSECCTQCRSETEYFKFKAKSGFRLGISYQLPCWEDVSLNFVFTYFHPKVNKKFHIPKFGSCEQGAIQSTTEPVDIGSSPFAGCSTNDISSCFVFNSPDSAVHTRVKLKYELYDLVLSKNFGCDCWTATPYIGARVLWLREGLRNEILGEYLADGSSFAGNRGTLWKINVPAAGLTLGVHGRYCFCGSLSVIGHFGVSVLGGKSKIHDNYRNFEVSVCGEHKHRAHRSQIITGWDGSLGLGYDLNFCTCPIRLGVGYEIQDWYNIPERARYINKNCLTFNGSTPSSLASPLTTVQTSDGNGHLTVHGLFVRVAFAF